MTNSRWKRRRIAAASALVVFAAACGVDSGAVDGADSFEDMEPVTLRVQSVHGPEAAPSRAYEVWREAVEEQSGGKIEFEMFYSGALAPIPEIEDAMAAGMIDLGTHSPIHNAARFPIDDAIGALNAVVPPSPLAGTLQGVAAQSALSFDEAYDSPFEAEGVQPLVRPITVMPAVHLACAGEAVQSLADAAGKRVRVPSEHLGREVEALGMTPTATTLEELYEAVERGIVDCVLALPSDIRDVGLIEVVDSWMIDPQVMPTGISAVQVSMSKQRWDSLPLVAQRLLWDTATDVFIPAMTEFMVQDQGNAITQAASSDVRFYEFDQDLRDALTDFHERSIASGASSLDNAESFTQRFIEVHEHWAGRLEDLGYDPAADDSFQNFDVGSVDMDAFIEQMREIRADGRP